MPTAVVHHPRLAWDFARQAVAAAKDTDDRFAWFHAQLGTVLGPEDQRELTATRRRLAAELRPDIRAVESGRWRVRIEDLLNSHPDLAAGLTDLHQSARQRLGAI